MMKTMSIINEKSRKDNRFNAGSKAREDIANIFADLGAKPHFCDFDFSEDRYNASFIKKAIYHIKTERIWEKYLRIYGKGSIVFFQFPIKAHTLFFSRALRILKRRHVKTVAIVHDLESLRITLFYNDINDRKKKGIRLKYEEILSLKRFDAIIVHNEKMKDILIRTYDIDSNKIECIEIFDYLIPDYSENKMASSEGKDYSVVIAGNLDYEKSGYVYQLPSEVVFNLYGTNYDGDYADNVHYKGAFLPDELPFHLEGSFGLVWDGSSIETCAGAFGEYLKINNPHKTSLYLACGMPVIIWKHAALATFVLDNHCGIVVDSLNELSTELSQISEDEYLKMKNNAQRIGLKLRTGTYTSKVFDSCVQRMA